MGLIIIYSLRMRKDIKTFAQAQESTFIQSIKITPDLSSTNSSFLHTLGSINKDSNNISLFRQHQFPRLFSPASKENVSSMRFSFNPNSINSNCKGTMKKSKQSSMKKLSFEKKLTYQNIKIDLSKPTRSNSLLSSGNKSMRSSSNFRKSLKSSLTQEQNIKVFVRVKPLSNKEQQECVSVINDQTIKIEDGLFAFDQIFGASTVQSTIFDKVGRQMCDKLFEGFNGTIFAYGQTGSGKTYTIFGENQKEKHGLIYRSIGHILAKKQQEKAKVKIKCTMVELYKQELIDMFATNRQLKLKQSKNAGVYIDGLRQISVKCENEVVNLVREASKNRKVASTKINELSSRSHTILTIYLQFQKFTSKLCLIDLAGSQKIRKSEVKGECFEEMKKINYSLSCLGNVINALTTRGKAEHIPFRDSKLTRILKDSLTGNFLTSIIVNCSNSYSSINQTTSSLKFAQRAKKVKLSATALSYKEQPDQQIQHLKSIIQKLNFDLEMTKKELNKYKQGQKEIPVFDSIPKDAQEGDLSGRNPIPSERANVEQTLKKYAFNSSIPKPKRIQIHLLNQISSLNVSKSVKNFGDISPSLSSLSYRYDESPDLSLSFSIQCEQDRKSSNR